MDRRTFLAGSLGGGGVSLAGCITFGGEPNEHLDWSVSLDTSPGSMDVRDLAYADGTVAAVSENRLFGVSRTGERGWELFEHASGVFGVGDGFLGVDLPGYHPRNDVNEAVLKKVTPDGKIRWQTDGYPLVDIGIGPDRVVVLHERDSEAMVSSLSLADGAEEWRTPLEHLATYLRLSQETVVTVGDGIVGYDRASGERRWDATAFDRYQPPVVDESRVYLTSDEEPYRVRVVDAADGERVTEYEIGSRMVPSSPLVVRDGLGLGTGYEDGEQQFFAVEPSSGDTRWWNAPEDNVILSHQSPETFVDDTAYLFDVGSILHAIDLDDGSVGWTFDAKRNYPVAIARRGTVYVLAGGVLHALDPAQEG